MTVANVTALRLAMRDNGYDPLPLTGKKCLLAEWSAQRKVSAKNITGWGVRYPGWSNTGILTERTPAFDGDILQADAAEAVADTVRDWFGERGTILTRFGAPPKFATLLRTERPFEKKQIHFIAPDGCRHKIEMLGAGQQLAVAGTHPHTKKPYAWHGGYAPFAIPRSSLPEIDEKEAEEFMNFVADMLTEKFGFRRVEAPSHGGNGAAGSRASVELEAEVASMCDGASTNAAQTRIIPSLLWKMHPDEVLDYVVDVTVAMAERRGLGWTRAAEIRIVRKRILSAYNNLLLKDYDPAIGAIPTWLPGEFHAGWIERLKAGRRPVIAINRSGFYVRSHQDAPADNSDAGSDASKTAAAAGKERPSEKQDTSKPKGRPWPTPYSGRAASQIPLRNFAMGQHYLIGATSVTASAGGIGKSTVAAGRCFLQHWSQSAHRRDAGKAPPRLGVECGGRR